MDKTTLKWFLGLINYYQRLLPGLALMIKPLTDLTLPRMHFNWTPACDTAFNLAKSTLSNTTSLAFPWTLLPCA